MNRMSKAIGGLIFLILMYGIVDHIEKDNRDQIIIKHSQVCRDCSRIIEVMNERNRIANETRIQE